MGLIVQAVVVTGELFPETPKRRHNKEKGEEEGERGDGLGMRGRS